MYNYYCHDVNHTYTPIYSDIIMLVDANIFIDVWTFLLMILYFLHSNINNDIIANQLIFKK